MAGLDVLDVHANVAETAVEPGAHAACGPLADALGQRRSATGRQMSNRSTL